MTGPMTRGTIIVAPRAPVVPCRVVDISAGGACLEINGQPVIPKRFVLLHGGIKKSCNVVWKAGKQIGVSF